MLATDRETTLSDESIESGWKHVVNHEKNVREIEDKILELIAIVPFDKKGMLELEALLEVQESLFEIIFMDNVCWDLDMICEMVERDLLDRDGK